MLNESLNRDDWLQQQDSHAGRSDIVSAWLAVALIVAIVSTM